LEILRWGYVGILTFSGLIYLIPFIGPSTMVLSATIAVIAPQYHPLGIGVVVSAGASLGEVTGGLPVTVASIVISVAITLVLVKVDIGKLQRRLTD